MNDEFDFLQASIKEINQIIKLLNLQNATGPGRVPMKLIISAANFIESYKLMAEIEI